MSDSNFFDQAGNFTQDAAVDTAVDGFVNQEIGNVASYISGDQAVQQMITIEAD